MNDGFFDEFVQADAYQIVQGPWVLYEGPASAIDLDDDIPEAFRLAMTISPVTGHTTVEGTVHIGEEELEFTEATRLTNEEDLTEVPEITVSGLDCNIKVECISITGEPVYRETLVPITCVVFPKTSIRKDPNGSGLMETNYNVYTESLLKIGDQIRYTDPHQGASIDIYVKDISGAVDLEDNSQPFRVLYCA